MEPPGTPSKSHLDPLQGAGKGPRPGSRGEGRTEFPGSGDGEVCRSCCPVLVTRALRG